MKPKSDAERTMSNRYKPGINPRPKPPRRARPLPEPPKYEPYNQTEPEPNMALLYVLLFVGAIAVVGLALMVIG